VKTKDILQRPYDLAAMIARLEDDYRHCWERARGGTSRTDALRLGGTPGRSRLEESVIRLDEIREELVRLYARLRVARREVRRIAAYMPTAELRLLIMMRFYERKPWPEVAKALDCSVRWAHTLAGKAVDMLRESTDPALTPGCQSEVLTDGRLPPARRP
jgi:DNA-directed RNA polymerase specialized sigma24 family protein